MLHYKSNIEDNKIIKISLFSNTNYIVSTIQLSKQDTYLSYVQRHEHHDKLDLSQNIALYIVLELFYVFFARINTFSMIK